MPSVTYMNQSAPFWDFVASLEQQGNSHPLFGNHENGNQGAEGEHGEGSEPHHGDPFFSPWGLGHIFGGRAFPYRAPPPEATHEERNAEEKTGEEAEKDNEEGEDMRDVNENDNGEGPSGNSGSDSEGCAYGRGRHGHCGGRRRGPCGSGRRGGWGGPGGRGPHGPPHHGPPHHGPGPHGPPHHGPPHHGPGPHHGPPHGFPHHGPPHHGPHHHGGPRGFGRRGGWGPWGRGHPFGRNFDPSALVAHFWEQFNDSHPSNNKATNDATEDHVPDADVFDTETAYIVHLSLPGAKKEDVGVNWDAEKSELSVAGVSYRPGDEEFLKTLAMGERKVGPFERKIRLGTRATPAHVDVDGITAKLEDGVLRVEVPKLDAGYVEIRKVDIE